MQGTISLGGTISPYRQVTLGDIVLHGVYTISPVIWYPGYQNAWGYQITVTPDHLKLTAPRIIYAEDYAKQRIYVTCGVWHRIYVSVWDVARKVKVQNNVRKTVRAK